MSPAESIAQARSVLGSKVQKAIREFQKETGMEVSAFDIMHHYCNGFLDADMTLVKNIRVTLPEKVNGKTDSD